MNSKFYDGTKLLSIKDINGQQPEIYMCTSNRSAGKTTYFNRLAVNRFLDRSEKFALIYRFKYELDNVSDKFFKDIGELFFPGFVMKSVARASGIYHELYICDRYNAEDKGRCCGYALAINSADQIKKNSHFFSDVQRMIFDEFQSETNHYCSDEVTKFQSVHQSLARGAGKQSRYLPVYMISNPVSLLNPYYTEMSIAHRLQKGTKFLRGDGWVLEQGFNKAAAEAQRQSAFNRAFIASKYMAYSAESVYLNDNEAFIEKPEGYSKYIATIIYDGNHFAIRSYAGEGVLYCDDKADLSFPVKIAVTTADHRINYVMLRQNNLTVLTLRFYFEKGAFRFRDLRAKEALMRLISY